MTSEKPAMERLLFGRDLPIGEQEALPVAGWRDSFGHAVVDGSEKVLIETSDAVEDRCYVLRSWTCRTQGFAGSGAHRGGCRDVGARMSGHGGGSFSACGSAAS